MPDRPMIVEEPSTARRPENRLGLDFRAEAPRFRAIDGGIIDVHSHIGGVEAARIYKDSAAAYGVTMTYSMTQLEECEPIREIMEGRIRYIAVPNYWATENRQAAMTTGYPKRIEEYHALGARIVKFWCAPRGRDFGREIGDPNLMLLDAPHRIDAMEAGAGLGMYFMAHIADPDTWFKTKYADSSFYGTKLDQYEPFERMLDRFTQPWIAAHMGGWPEDLEFLTGLLERHDNLYLDTSATKWMVRELSKHSPEELVAFLRRFNGRILFGSDIVTSDDHLSPSEGTMKEMGQKADSPERAFDLYAGRYWALRTMWETDYDGESPISDPDLALVDPERYEEFDAPPLRGKSVPADLLQTLYRGAADRLLEGLFAG